VMVSVQRGGPVPGLQNEANAYITLPNGQLA
jgi:hypothetical protein